MKRCRTKWRTNLTADNTITKKTSPKRRTKRNVGCEKVPTGSTLGVQKHHECKAISFLTCGYKSSNKKASKGRITVEQLSKVVLGVSTDIDGCINTLHWNNGTDRDDFLRIIQYIHTQISNEREHFFSYNILHTFVSKSDILRVKSLLPSVGTQILSTIILPLRS